MSDKESRKLHVYQPEPAAETFKFAIGGPCFDPIRRARFASRDDAQAAMTEIERLRAERPTCEWTRDGETYDTGCGECFEFTNAVSLADQPAIQWCPFCGGLIRQAAAAAERSE